MATYLLVHGSMHGGWVWDRLRAELESRGHNADRELALELYAAS
jgi:hypothetical protein